MAQWTDSVLSSVDSIVDFFTDKIVRPAHKFARGSVYGMVISILVVLILFFLFIAIFRATTIFLDVHYAYLLWGGIFIAIGTLLWVKK